jgi:predicted metal-binding protein
LNSDQDAAAPAPFEPLTTKVKPPAQVLFCKGCCCGKTERGLPEVPVDRLKKIWKAEKLNKGVQLTISGCLGPCDLPNVAVVVTPQGTEWYGRLDGDAHYDALIEWARACVAESSALPLPESLAPHRFERF